MDDNVFLSYLQYRKQFLNLVYWYGNKRNDLSKDYSLIQSKSIMRYDMGCENGYTEVHKDTSPFLEDGIREIVKKQ